MWWPCWIGPYTSKLHELEPYKPAYTRHGMIILGGICFDTYCLSFTTTNCWQIIKTYFLQLLTALWNNMSVTKAVDPFGLLWHMTLCILKTGISPIDSIQRGNGWKCSLPAMSTFEAKPNGHLAGRSSQSRAHQQGAPNGKNHQNGQI